MFSGSRASSNFNIDSTISARVFGNGSYPPLRISKESKKVVSKRNKYVGPSRKSSIWFFFQGLMLLSHVAKPCLLLSAIHFSYGWIVVGKHSSHMLNRTVTNLNYGFISHGLMINFTTTLGGYTGATFSPENSSEIRKIDEKFRQMGLPCCSDDDDLDFIRDQLSSFSFAEEIEGQIWSAEWG